jgi:hypothetical protein
MVAGTVAVPFVRGGSVAFDMVDAWVDRMVDAWVDRAVGIAELVLPTLPFAVPIGQIVVRCLQ